MILGCIIWLILQDGLVWAAKKNATLRPKAVLPENYIKEIRPPTLKGRPIAVQFSVFVVDINSINVEDMDFRVDMFVTQQWTESRLKITNDIFEEGDDYVTFPSPFFDNLWQPDPYFINTKVVEISSLTHQFSSVTLYRNKTVRYSARMHAIVACQMEFKLYPVDVQSCPVYIESFSYNSKKVKLRWSDAGVSVNPELKLLQYHFVRPIKFSETQTYKTEKGGNFSRLVLYFTFEREIGHHLIQSFAPSTLVVVLSWFSFWLGLDAIPGRVTLLITCMLTLVTMFTGLKSDIPPVAYIKALDLWMAGCMIFVFVALGEFLLVKILYVHYHSKKYGRASLRAGQMMELGMRNPASAIGASGRRSYRGWYAKRKQSRRLGLFRLSWKNESGKEKVLWREIDRKSRVIFPMLFLLFSLIYWPLLLLEKF